MKAKNKKLIQEQELEKKYNYLKRQKLLYKKMKKNIQVIDGAYNSCYAIYSIEEEYFNLIFPNGQDIEFISDFVSREGKKLVDQVLKELWKSSGNRGILGIDKKSVNGIHGTLFNDYEDCECGKDITKKKKYYLSKKWEKVVNKE